MLLTICSVARGSLYHSELAVLSTGCQHFAWLAVCRKWLKTGLDYKSWPKQAKYSATIGLSLYTNLLQILCRHLCRSVAVCRLSQFLTKLKSEQSLFLRTSRTIKQTQKSSGEAETGSILWGNTTLRHHD